MKKIKIYLILLLTLEIVACEDRLDLPPVSSASQEDFYQTESDFELAINSSYASLRSVYSDIVLFSDIRSDNTRPVISGSVSDRRDFDLFSIANSNPEILAFWTDSYQSINRSNAILDRIDEAAIDESIQKRIKGEALFIRGLTYFNLVRVFGNIPLVLNELSPEEATEFAQKQSAEVYELILSDLAEAALLLPNTYTSDKVGKATRIAAYSLLGKINLTLGRYEETIESLNKVVDLEGRGVDLLPSFAQVFDISNEYNDEIIFAVRWSEVRGNGNSFSSRFTNTVAADNTATEDLLLAFENGDIRKDLTISTSLSNENLIIKFGVNEGESDWPVLRYADVLLMLSEAYNEAGYSPSGTAFNLLNRVRSRANLSPLTPASLPDQQSFRIAVEQERRAELVSEGHRWFDLIRTKRYISVMNKKGFGVQGHHKLFPIPNQEILKINNSDILRQNPGY